MTRIPSMRPRNVPSKVEVNLSATAAFVKMNTLHSVIKLNKPSSRRAIDLEPIGKSICRCNLTVSRCGSRSLVAERPKHGHGIEG